MLKIIKPYLNVGPLEMQAAQTTLPGSEANLINRYAYHCIDSYLNTS